jgi:hypothetical protein
VVTRLGTTEKTKEHKMTQVDNRMLSIPEFTGKEDVEDFIARIDLAQKSIGLANDATAELATSKMPARSKATDWIKAVQGGGGILRGKYTNLNIWLPTEEIAHRDAIAAADGPPAIPAQPEIMAAPAKTGGLRAALRDKFMKQPTNSEMASMRRGLVQKAAEDTEDFYTRCILINQICDKGIFKARDLTTAENEAWYLIYHKEVVGMDFVNGLRPQIRTAVIGSGADGLDATFAAAINYEKAHAGAASLPGPPGKVAAIAEANVDAVAAKGAATKKDCYYCGLIGHLAAACLFKKKDVEAGNVQDRHAEYPLKPKGKKSKVQKKGKAAPPTTKSASAVSTPTLAMTDNEIMDFRKFREEARAYDAAQAIQYTPATHAVKQVHQADPFASMYQGN